MSLQARDVISSIDGMVTSITPTIMTSDSEEDGLEDLESEGEYDEDENVLMDAQDEETEDSDEVCMYVLEDSFQPPTGTHQH